MRTLVVHTGGIGDFLLACPSIACLEGQTELVGRPERLQIAVEAGIASAAHNIDAVGFDSLFSTPNERFIAFARRFDRAFTFMRDPDGTIERGLRHCGVRHVSVFSGLPDAQWRAHASDYYAKCLGVSIDPNFALRVQPDSVAHEAIIHPGSGSVKKNWLLDNFRKVAHSLEEDGHPVEWCLGPAEHERMPDAMDLRPMLADCLLVELARALKNARLFIGNDSGITHLAAMVGCPTVAIFGVTDPTVWAPRGPHVRTLHERNWPDLTTVLCACEELLSRGGSPPRGPS